MKRLPIIVPCLGRPEADAAKETIFSGWITQGPKVKLFEERFSAYVGAQYACAVSSCTSALHLALLTLGVRPGDVVVTVSHSFIATANAIRHCGAEPVFVDIDPQTLNMDPERLADTLRNDFEARGKKFYYKHLDKIAVGESPLCCQRKPAGRLGAILAVHQVGMPANLLEILKLAKQYCVPVLEDAACAIGSEISFDGGRNWEKIGKPHGEAACFSFHPRKIITTGDGGMIVTKRKNNDRNFRLLRHHGMDVSDSKRHISSEVLFEHYRFTGYNYRMTDIQAAVGIEQLKRLARIITRRRQVADWYREEFDGLEELILQAEPTYARSNWQSFVVRLSKAINQKRLMQKMLEAGVDTRRGIMCCHLELPYARAWPRGAFPESEKAQHRGIILPLFDGMGRKTVKKLAQSLIQVIRNR